MSANDPKRTFGSTWHGNFSVVGPEPSGCRSGVAIRRGREQNHWGPSSARKSRDLPELDTAFATIIQAGAGALQVGSGPFFTSQRQRLAVLSARHGLPSSYPEREYVAAGGLLSYGTSQADAYRRAGIYVARILRGEKPGDMPVEQPTKFELVINLGTAKTLGLTIPNSMQLLADELIE